MDFCIAATLSWQAYCLAGTDFFIVGSLIDLVSVTGHALCVTCQDPSVPMQAMQCTDKNCRRCGVVTSPVVSTSPPVRDEVIERSPRRQIEQPRDTGPKVCTCCKSISI